MKFSQYDVVRVVRFIKPELTKKANFDLRAPVPGDVATIIDIYDDPAGYELECSDVHGITQWMISVQTGDVELELLAPA